MADAPTDLFVGGKWVPAAAGDRFDVYDPATGSVIASVADGRVEDALAAVDAADAAAAGWAATAPRERAEVLRRAFELMTRDAEHLVRLVTLENGKALTDARGEVTYAAESSPGRVGDPKVWSVKAHLNNACRQRLPEPDGA